MPTFRQLRTFILVAETGSISKSATFLGLAPSAVSAQVAALEQELECRLLDRDGRGVRPTDKGRELLRRAQQIIASVRDLEHEIRIPGTTVSGRVTVGLVPDVIAALAPALLAAVFETLPHVSLRLVEALSGDLHEMLTSGRVDLASLYLHEVQPGHVASDVRRDALALIGRADLIDGVGQASLGRTMELPLVLQSARHGLRGVIETAAAGIDMEGRPEAEVDSVSALLALLPSAHLFSILPASVAREAATRDVRLDWAPIPDLYCDTAIVRLRSSRSPAVLEVGELLRGAWTDPPAGAA